SSSFLLLPPPRPPLFPYTTLFRSDAPFLYNMRYVWPVPAAQLEGQDLASAEFFQAPIGAGPYKFESWTTGGDFVAVANENFWERSEEHTSELQSRENLVCRLLLEK